METGEEVFERHRKSHIAGLGDAGHVPREKRMSQIEGRLLAGRASAALSLSQSAGRSIDWPIRHQLMPHGQNSSRDIVILTLQPHLHTKPCSWIPQYRDRSNRSNQHPFAGCVVWVILFAAKQNESIRVSLQIMINSWLPLMVVFGFDPSKQRVTSRLIFFWSRQPARQPSAASCIPI